MILDLSAFVEETLDITMPDGKVLNIRKPSQKRVIELLKFKNIQEETDEAKIISSANNFVLSVLNDNKNGIVFTIDDINEMFFDMKMAIIKAYGAFVAGLQNNPN